MLRLNICDQTLKFILKMFNKSAVLSDFPTQRKVAKVIVLSKPGKHPTDKLCYSVGQLYEKTTFKILSF
jgi:hypothetical protein